MFLLRLFYYGGRDPGRPWLDVLPCVPAPARCAAGCPALSSAVLEPRVRGRTLGPSRWGPGAGAALGHGASVATLHHCGFACAAVPSPKAVIRGVPCCLVGVEGRVQLCSRPGARTHGHPLPRGRGKPETERRLSCAGDSLWQPRLGFAQDSQFGITWDKNSVSLKSECVESLSSGCESPPESLLASRGHLTKNKGSFRDTPSKPLSYVDSFAQGDCLLPEWCFRLECNMKSYFLNVV